MLQDRPGWNTYDPLGMNRIVRFPELYEIRVSVYAPASGAYASKFYFLEHLGDVGNALRAEPHTVDCSYACAKLCFGGFTFKVEYAAAQDGGLVCCVTPLAVADPFTLVLVEALRAWELDGEVELGGDNIISFPCATGGKVNISATQDHSSVHHPGTPVTSGVYGSEEDLVRSLLEQKTLNQARGNGRLAALGFIARIPLNVTAWVDEAPERISRDRPLPYEISTIAREARERCEKASPGIQGEPFEGCYRAVTSVMNWMTVWDQLHGIPYVPVSRSWVDNYMVRIGFDRSVRGPLTGLWDSFFHALLHSVNDETLAEANIRVVLGDHALMDEGYPTNYMVSTFKSGDRSQPPLGSLAVWKLYRRFGNGELLEWAYPRLKRWRQWWKRRRDGNADGLLEWGSNLDVQEQGNDAGTLFAAKCESGMDNSPLYDEADYDSDIGTMNLTDVGLNALYAADAMFLSKIAGALGNTDERERFEMEHMALCEKINAELWNEKAQAYADKFWNGDFSTRMGPTMFYPLMARAPEPDQVEQLVRVHLLNEREFWGEFVIPTISRNDPAFTDQLYWRGRVWPPVNYLVYLGLKAYGLDDVAHELARRSVRLFMGEWKLRGHCHESYNAITGEGDDVPVAAHPGSNGSDRFYPWGALLALMGIEELFDVDVDEGIRFGCRFLRDESRLSNIPFRGSMYDIRASSEETCVCRDGEEIFFSTPGTNVRSYVAAAGKVGFAVAGGGSTSFRVSEFLPFAAVAINIDGRELCRVKADESGAASFDVATTPSYVSVVLTGEIRK